MRSAVLLAILALASALKLPVGPDTISRRSLCSAAAAVFVSPLAAQANVGDLKEELPIIDVNNAGADAFRGLPGLYPTIATKVVQRGPFKNKEEMYKAMEVDDNAAVVIDRLKQYEKQYEFGVRGNFDRGTGKRSI